MCEIELVWVSPKSLQAEFCAKIDRLPLVFGAGIPGTVYRYNPVANGGFWLGLGNRLSLFFAHFSLLYFRNVHFEGAQVEFVEIFLALAASGAGENRLR